MPFLLVFCVPGTGHGCGPAVSPGITKKEFRINAVLVDAGDSAQKPEERIHSQRKCLWLAQESGGQDQRQYQTELLNGPGGFL
jgi:hypothetical protein